MIHRTPLCTRGADEVGDVMMPRLCSAVLFTPLHFSRKRGQRVHFRVLQNDSPISPSFAKSGLITNNIINAKMNIDIIILTQYYIYNYDGVVINVFGTIIISSRSFIHYARKKEAFN